MRTRAAILSMLALGFLLSTTGAGLAVTGLADNDQASTAQYPENNPTPSTPTTPTPEGETPAPETDTPPAGGEVVPEEESAPTDEVLPEEQTAPEESAVQPARQVQQASGPSALPFTGFAALPVLLLGLALLSGGLVMRRSARD